MATYLERLKADRERIAERVKEFLMGHYLVTSGDKYRLNADDHKKLDQILRGEEPEP